MTRVLMSPRDRRSERGVALAYVGFALLVFMGFAVVAVDTARIAFTASESQAVADAGATAGIRTLAALYSGGTGNPKTDAVAVASQNRIDGAPAPIAAGDVQCGNWNFQNGSFAAGFCDTTSNAVRATATKQVNNIVAGVFGASFAHTTVTRRATSALSAPNAARPLWPLAIKDCSFQQYASSNNCSDLPKALVAPTGAQTACFTTFLDNSANTGGVIEYLPTSCGGGGGQQALINVGTSINLTNGTKPPDFRAMQACFNQGLTTWVVPIVPCNTVCNQSAVVTAFAEIQVKAVTVNGANGAVTMDAICKIDSTVSGGGGPDRGVKTIAMVE
jgi:hypothetical protein